MSVTRPTLMSEAAGLAGLAEAVVVAMAVIATAASSIAARGFLVNRVDLLLERGRGACYGTYVCRA